MSDRNSPKTAGSPQFVDQLQALCRTEGIALSAAQAQLCHRHVELMLHWNQRSNLTRITQPEAILAKHLLDSLLPARWLPQHGRALDVGSGAGFPGVPLKILCPDLDLVLIESHGKKVSFLKVLLAELRLERLAVLQRRWEDLTAASTPELAGGASLITVRALKPPGRQFAVFAVRMLQPGGVLAYWGGPEDRSDASQTSEAAGEASEWSTAGLEFIGSHAYRLPEGYGRRRLLLWQRALTPADPIPPVPAGE